MYTVNVSEMKNLSNPETVDYVDSFNFQVWQTQTSHHAPLQANTTSMHNSLGPRHPKKNVVPFSEN